MVNIGLGMFDFFVVFGCIDYCFFMKCWLFYLFVEWIFDEEYWEGLICGVVLLMVFNC